MGELIGREPELETVVRAIADRVPLAVVGEVGVGKTALVHAALERSGIRAREGGALATLSWMPLLPIQRALGFRPTVGDAAFVARQVERRLAGRVLLIDDLHWADALTREVVALLAVHQAPIVAVRRGDPGASTVLDEVEAAGFHRLDLEPLVPDAAAMLVRRIRPDLGASAVARVVRRTGGNPLLIEELTATGEPSESLRLALAARLRVLTSAGRELIGLLSLAGRPLNPTDASAALSELVDAGLVVVESGQAAVRHALIGETAGALIGAEARRALHLRLADASQSRGERARHLLLAGMRSEALRLARAAARGARHPGERAAHLRVAAEAAEGKEADELLIEAAAALVEANEPMEAGGLLERVTGRERRIVARAAVVRWYVAWQTHTTDNELRSAIREGLDAVAGGIDDEAEVHLRALEARTELIHEGDRRHGLRLARSAVRLAERRRAGEALSRGVLGAALMFAADDRFAVELGHAIRIAAREGDARTELTAANNLVYGLLLHGRLDEAQETARRSAGRSARLRLRGWERRFLGWEAAVSWGTGDVERCVSLAAELLEEPMPRGDREVIETYLCQALIDLGRHPEARKRADALRANAQADPESLGEALWVTADLELATGRPQAALAAADEYRGRFGEMQVSETARFVELTRAWARYELGLPFEPALFPNRFALTKPSELELRGIAQLSDGDLVTAARTLARAAAGWQNRNGRAERRCRLMAAQAMLAHPPLRAAAVRRLVEIERQASERSLGPLLERCRAALRTAGVRKSAPRQVGPGGPLSRREQEVLDLAADGLTNSEIARRLGTSLATVKSQMRSARRKLGASRRTQAPALAIAAGGLDGSARALPPLVVIEGPDEVFEAAHDELGMRGWRLVSGWESGDTRLAPGEVRYGPVRDASEAGAAVLVAVGGHGVLVHGLAPRTVLDRLCDDLRRLGQVEHRVGVVPLARLNREQRALTGLLLTGKKLGEAARELHLSRRTADRRLAEARRAFGARSTAELLARLREG